MTDIHTEYWRLRAEAAYLENERMMTIVSVTRQLQTELQELWPQLTLHLRASDTQRLFVRQAKVTDALLNLDCAYVENQKKQIAATDRAKEEFRK